MYYWKQSHTLHYCPGYRRPQQLMSTHYGQVTRLGTGTMFLLFAFFFYPCPQPWDRPSLILSWLLKSFSNWSLPFQTSFHTTVELIFLKYSFDHFICVIKSLQWFSTVYRIKSKGLSLTFKTLYKVVLFCLPFPSALSRMASGKIPQSQQFSRISEVSKCETAQCQWILGVCSRLRDWWDMEVSPSEGRLVMAKKLWKNRSMMKPEIPPDSGDVTWLIHINQPDNSHWKPWAKPMQD